MNRAGSIALAFNLVVVASAHAQPIELPPSAFLPYDYANAEQNYRIANPTLPREITATDLVDFTDEATATKIVEVGKLVYRSYVWATRKPRYPAPEKYVTLFSEAKPGYCEGGTAMVRTILSSVGITSDSFNFIAPHKLPSNNLISGQNFEQSGHTVARVKFEHGAVIVDPTYGFMLTTLDSDFDSSTFAGKRYKIFRLFDYPADPTGVLSPYAGLMFYDDVAVFPSFAGRSSEPLVTTTPIIQILSKSVQIGKIDGSNTDITNAFGGYANHIGLWYMATEHIWRFAPTSPGTVQITFHLLGGDNPVLKSPLIEDIQASGAKLISIDQRTDQDSDQNIMLKLDAKGPFSIKLSSKSSSSRLVDAVSIQEEGSGN
jgi:hypothetical protein